ncbi:hypothetical protein D9M71_555920 [compost metagenome]
MIQPFDICSRRKVQTHYRNIVKIGSKISSFKIHMVNSSSKNNIIRFCFRQNCYAAVSFFCCRIVVLKRITRRCYIIYRNLILCSFYFLKAYYIRICLLQPLDKPFVYCRSNSVYIIRNNFHQ